MYRLSLLMLLIAIPLPALAGEPETRVEQSEPLVAPMPMRDTMEYQATAAEKEASKDWKKAELASGAPGIDGLQNKVGQRVCWFGIVREVREDKEKNETLVLAEMKYFDGQIDVHLQVVSIFGAGDFRAALRGTGHKIKPLCLARFYGKVTKEEGGIPLVAADYVRVWDWGLFAFVDYGKDKGNPKWRKLRTVADDEVYSDQPDDAYYEERIGKR